MSTRPDDSEGSWLFVLPWDLHHIGGVNQVVKNLFDTMSSIDGPRPALMVNSWAHRRTVESLPDGRRTLHLQLRSPLRPQRLLLSTVDWALRLPGALRRLAALVERHDVKVVNPHFPDLDVVNWILVRRFRGRSFRIMVSFHGRDLENILAAGWLARTTWKAILRRVDVISTCAMHLSERLVTALEVDSRKVVTLDNGVDAEKIVRCADQARRSGLPQDYLLSLGTLEHKKGHDVLLQAFDRVASAHHSLSLVVAGRPGTPEEVRALHAVRERCANRDRIQILENLTHEEAMFALSRARMFVLASRSEPFGISILEAAVLGRPIVASSVCGVLKRLGSSAIRTVPPDAVEQLASALAEGLRDPPPGIAIDALRNRVRAQFAWSTVMKQYRGAVRR